MRKMIFLVAVMAILGMFTTSALAAVTFEPTTGQGFVGKGDVQLVYGWNNKQLQDNAALVDFRYSSTTESTWSCTNTRNDKVQDKERTTTTEGVLDTVTREKNQVTGFRLQGFSGSNTTTHEGPPAGSCPSGPWVYNNDLDTQPLGGGLEITTDGATYHPIG